MLFLSARLPGRSMRHCHSGSEWMTSVIPAAFQTTMSATGGTNSLSVVGRRPSPQSSPSQSPMRLPAIAPQTFATPPHGLRAQVGTGSASKIPTSGRRRASVSGVPAVVGPPLSSALSVLSAPISVRPLSASPMTTPRREAAQKPPVPVSPPTPALPVPANAVSNQAIAAMTSPPSQSSSNHPSSSHIDSALRNSSSGEISGTQWSNLLQNYRRHNIGTTQSPDASPTNHDRETFKTQSLVSQNAASLTKSTPSHIIDSEPSDDSYSFDHDSTSLDNLPANITAHPAQPRTSVVAQNMSALQPSVLDQLSQLASIPRADTFSPPGQFATPSRAAPAFVQSRSIVAIQERPRNDAQRIIDLEQQLASAEQRIQFLTAALQHVSSERDIALARVKTLESS